MCPTIGTCHAAQQVSISILSELGFCLVRAGTEAGMLAEDSSLALCYAEKAATLGVKCAGAAVAAALAASER